MTPTALQPHDIWQLISTHAPAFGLKVLAALAAWLVGRWLIGFAMRLLVKGMKRSDNIDATLSHYLKSIVQFALNVVLVLAILDIFGVSTTSFAALLAGAGLAIGTAWGGLLTHFAAGVFMQVLRPYKVGDVVSIGGLTGTVKELGLFGTTLVTAENVVAIMGNNKVFSETISNFSTLPVRRVDCSSVKLATTVDVFDAIERIKAAVALVPNVAATPAPQIDLLQITPEGPLLCIRPFAATAHYQQVFFDTNQAVMRCLITAGYPSSVAATPLPANPPAVSLT
jgi:small conductance mechanosensitive channel